MRTCLRRSLATGLVFRRQLPLAPRCYAFLPGCGQGLALATTARPAPLRSALLLRRKLRRYLVSLCNCWPRQQPTPGSDAAQRVSPDFSPEVPVPSRRLRTGFRPFTCSLPAGYPTAPRPARTGLPGASGWRQTGEKGFRYQCTTQRKQRAVHSGNKHSS